MFGEKKLNIQLSYNPEIELLGIYPRVMKIYTYTRSSSQIFIAALLVIAKNWKLPKCLSIYVVKQTGQHSYNGILSAIKRKELLTDTTT